MKERPIFFSGEMVRATLSGSKTQTRRLVDPEVFDLSRDRGGYAGATKVIRDGASRSAVFLDGSTSEFEVACPYGAPGDRLWVRETWYDDTPDEPPHARPHELDGSVDGIEYRATHECRAWEAGCPCNPEGDGKRSVWRSSLHMPRWASRISLEITGVRVERLQEITVEDAIDEGVQLGPSGLFCGAVPRGDFAPDPFDSPVDAFASLWDSLNAKRAPWASNPWVWVISFRRLEQPSRPLEEGARP